MAPAADTWQRKLVQSQLLEERLQNQLLKACDMGLSMQLV